MTRICVCDVGLGNLRSVERALQKAAELAARTITIEVTRDPDAVRRADAVVVPGQGGFGDCARALASGLGDAVVEQIARGTPYLGICLGLQVLFSRSAEAPGEKGLGVFPGEVALLEGGIDVATGMPLKVPHIGWNTVEPTSGHRGALPDEAAHFYFVHSYVVKPDDPKLVCGTTEYGARFVSAIARDNLFACQFHPEKSQAAGLELLARFLRA